MESNCVVGARGAWRTGAVVGAIAMATVLAGCVLPGCGHAWTFSPPPAMPETNATFRPEATEQSAELLQTFGDALSDVPLTPQQHEQLARLGAAVNARHQSELDARTALANALAAQVERGRVDTSELVTRIDAYDNAVVDVAQDDLQFMNKLHALLTPAQRDTVAQALLEKVGKRNVHGVPMSMQTRYQLFRRDVELTKEQETAIWPRLEAEAGFDAPTLKAEADDYEQRARAAVYAFSKPDFDATKVAVDTNPAVRAKRAAMRTVKFFEVVAPELTPDQRAKAAARIRSQTGSRLDDL